MTTCWTCSGATSARSNAALLACPPSSVASSEASPPPSLPMGVRAAERMTVLGIDWRLRDRWRGRPMVVVWRAVYVETTRAPALSTDADTVVYAVFDDEPLEVDDAREPLEALLDSGEAKGRYKHLALTHVEGRRVMLVGVGEREDLDGERARVAAALAHRRARELGAQTLCWALPPGAGDEIAEGLVQGTLLGAYRFDRYKRGGNGNGDEPGDATGIQRLLLSATADVEGSVARAVIVAGAQNRARELGNRPPNDLTPTALGAYAAELAAGRPALPVSVLRGA